MLKFLFAGLLLPAGPATAAPPAWPLRHYQFNCFEAGGVPGPGLDPGSLLRFRPIGESRAPRVSDDGVGLAIRGGVFEAPRVGDCEQNLFLVFSVRPHGLGKHRGNDGTPNAMLVCNGSGYYDGWRLMLDETPAQRVRFEIGRKEGAFGVAAPEGLNPGLWNIVAVTWDKQAVTIYINGIQSVRTEWDGAGYVPAEQPLRVGYAGFGVGETDMDVFDLIICQGVPDGVTVPGAIERLHAQSTEFNRLHQTQTTNYRVLMQCKDGRGYTLAPDILGQVEKWVGQEKLGPRAPAALRELRIARAEALAVAGRADEAARIYEQLAAQHPGGPEEKRLRAFTSKKQRVIYDPRVVVPEAPDADRFFIAPDGDDQNPGTQEKPFATLQRARDAIRAARRNGAWKNGGTVFVRGGTYGVLATATFTEEDSGTAGAPIVYRAWQGEHPVFSGGVAVRDFLPETGDIRVARLPGVTPARQESYGWGVWRERVFEVYEDGEPLQVARWPNTGVARVGSVPRDDVITVQGPVGRWHAAKEMMLHGYWRYLWADATLPARAVGNELVFTERPVDGVLAGQPFYVMNLLEELDEPGEWFFDRENGRLHIWPRGKGDIVATHLPHPFIHGEKVRHIRFEGLTFEYGQENGLVFVSSENVWVAGCTVRRLGGSALKVMGDSRGVRVVGNRFHTLGHKGIFFEGGDRKTLRGSGSVIENNEVFDFARRSRTYQPALQLEGCGTRVSHNWFHDGPSSAMRIEGNDHDISFNLFERLVTESDDQGAIDMWGDPSYRGVVFRHNIFRDIGGGTPAPCGRNGIRFDDGICGMVVYGNIFERASQGNFGGVQIHGGDNNFVENNLFIDCAIGVSFSPWDWQRWQGFLAGDEIRQKLHGRVDIGGDVFQKKYPALARLGTPAEHNRNSICNNAFVRCGRTFFNAPDAAERVMNQSFDTLPDGFLENGFRSFAPIPVDRIGVRASPLVRFLR